MQQNKMAFLLSIHRQNDRRVKMNDLTVHRDGKPIYDIVYTAWI